MSKFSFSVSNGFATLGNISILSNSITNNIPVELQTINPYGDAIEIIFTSDLNDQQKVTLNNIVSNWDNVTAITYSKIVPINVHAHGIDSTVHKRYGVYPYLGSDLLGDIKKICISSYGTTTDGYCIRIFDITNNNIIAESECYNIIEDIIDLGPISNIPKTPALLEIQIKKLGTNRQNTIYSDIIVFYS